jgi:hypothetical protein
MGDLLPVPSVGRDRTRLHEQVDRHPCREEEAQGGVVELSIPNPTTDWVYWCDVCKYAYIAKRPGNYKHHGVSMRLIRSPKKHK